MITDKDKAKVIAELKRLRTPEELSEKYDIPLGLIKEWERKLDVKDLTVIESKISVIEDITNGELEITNSSLLQSTLEDASIDLIKQVRIAATTGDMVHANSIKLCAEAISNLYKTIILKNNTAVNNDALNLSNKSLSSFQKLMRE